MLSSDQFWPPITTSPANYSRQNSQAKKKDLRSFTELHMAEITGYLLVWFKQRTPGLTNKNKPELQFFKWPLEADSKTESITRLNRNLLIFKCPKLKCPNVPQKFKCLPMVLITVWVSKANFPFHAASTAWGVNFWITHLLKLYLGLKFCIIKGAAILSDSSC